MSKYNSATDNWTVYIHTVPKEITNYDYDKYYVGITKQKPNDRWMNGLGYKGQIFYKAIEKYGWNNIKHQIIACNLSSEDAISLERFLILTYDSLNGHHGYNVTIGGDGFNGCEMADSTVKKLRDISKRKWEDSEYVKHVKNNLPRGEEHHKSRSVVLLNTREVFITETEALKAYNLSAQNQLSLFCNGETNCEKKDKNGNCLTWVWYEDYVQMSEQDIKDKIYNSTRYLNKRPLKEEIVCLNTGKIYDYAFKIFEDYSFQNIDNIYLCCRERRIWSGKTAEGERLTWAFLQNYMNMSEKDIEEKIQRANNFHPVRKDGTKILDRSTNIVYSSIRECSRATKISREQIKKEITMELFDYEANKSLCRFRKINREK